MSQPFSHEDLELKQHFLQLARDYRQKMNNLENELAAALLYMNVADYLAEYLVVGLTEMSKVAVSKYYLGVVSMGAPKRDSFNIGDSMKHLERYDFPRKSDILSELAAINNARKKVAHQILKTKAPQLSEIDEAVELLATHTEELVNLVDEISLGLPPTNLLEKLEQLGGQEVVEAAVPAQKPEKGKKPTNGKK